MEISILALPLIASIISGFFGKFIGDRNSEIVTSLLVSISAILSAIVFYEVIFNQYEENIIIATWINSGSLEVNWSMKIDALSSVMLVVVTFVSALVHIYSIGYMSHDPHKPRFMAYLSLFTFAMLMLVTADNFIQLFFGWEGVGLCSYFLIGFWFKKETANAAAIKAFVVNRVGDFGFALGIFLIFYLFGTVNYTEVFNQIPTVVDEKLNFLGIQINAVDLICILLFIGAMGKSAQIFLHTWLPDAMEGPTPVSALIHAATMVTAGVFLVVRCSPIYEYSELALNIVTVVGMSTAFFAASVALVQTDIKKIIAYSTCSQLGYMFFAAGVGAYNVAMFHLFTHAFFKALLFLGSGSVIHAFKDEQNINNMGGVWRKLPYTYALMIIGTLALTGFPFLSGFYSKDAIIEFAYLKGSPIGNYAATIGILTAFLTSIYSWRLFFKSFHGSYNNKKIPINETPESPLTMLVPFFFLGAGAYKHHIPSTVDHIIQRSEFLTSYTPYQPEVSQGTLQYLFEFQTQVSLITGMDVSNASMYDGSTSTAEAVSMAKRITKRNKVVLSPTLHPQYAEVINTLISSNEDEIDYEFSENFEVEKLISKIDDSVSCIVVQNPDFFGSCHSLEQLAEYAHSKGALLIVVVNEIISLGMMKSPGEMGADIVACEGQSLGNPLNFGGPYIGLMSTKDKYVRQLPGRIVGETIDMNGEKGFVLTLATREQHIRREKATSNICTNSGLCSLAFTIHLSLLGEMGFKKLSKLNHESAIKLYNKLKNLEGFEVKNNSFFNEFTVKVPINASVFVERMAEKGILAGVPVSRLSNQEGDFSNLLLVASSEINSDSDRENFIKLAKEVCYE